MGRAVEEECKESQREKGSFLSMQQRRRNPKYMKAPVFGSQQQQRAVVYVQRFIPVCLSEEDKPRRRQGVCLPLVSVELIIIYHCELETMCLFKP